MHKVCVKFIKLILLVTFVALHPWLIEFLSDFCSAIIQSSNRSKTKAEWKLENIFAYFKKSKNK